MRCATPFAVVLTLAACTGRGTSAPAAGVSAGEAAMVTEARTLFPRTLEMHQKIVARSCAPNTGVCHNTSNYPDLSTPGSMLQAVGSWCNLEIPDPTQGYDLCERPGDLLVADDGSLAGLVTEIAWVERVAIDDWRVSLRDAPAAALIDAPVSFYAEVPNVPVLLPAAEWLVRLSVDAGSKEARVTVGGVADNPFIELFIDEVLASLVGGDANRNGTFGADVRGEEEPATILDPGSLARSYLWGRITGTVPGSRMPLANEALSDAEYLAVGCFIETLAARGADVAVEDAIDYDNCELARDPPSLAVLE
jgi:hypothetical protein